MHPCFRGLVLNVVLDVFLPLIGVWLQGERWQLGETALPLMNSSSSILPKRPVDTAFLPVNKASLRSVPGPSWTTTTVCSTPHCCTGFTPACTLTRMTPGFALESFNFNLFLNAPPSCCIPLVCIQLSGSAVFSQLLIISNEVKTLLFALLLIHKRALSRLGYESRHAEAVRK